MMKVYQVHETPEEDRRWGWARGNLISVHRSLDEALDKQDEFIAKGRNAEVYIAYIPEANWADAKETFK